MGWFQLAKYGQIWKTDYQKDSVGSMLSALYEITYKIQTLQNQGFTGHPKRYNNILMGLENSARQIIGDMTDILVIVFEDWLSNHAILSPRNWASKRMEDYNAENQSPKDIASILLNGVNFDPKDKMPKIQPSDIMENMDNAVESGQARYVSEWFKNVKSEMLQQNLDENESNNNNEHSDYSMSEDSIRQANEEMIFSEYCQTYFYKDLAGLILEITTYYPMVEVYKDFFQFGLFPIWYGYWKAKGIDNTRNRIEKTYQTLLQIPNMNINQALANINLVINVAHQTGDMVEYIAMHTGESTIGLRSLMKQLSNQTDFIDWDVQLKEIGSQFPRKNQIRKPVPQLNEPQQIPENQDINT